MIHWRTWWTLSISEQAGMMTRHLEKALSHSQEVLADTMRCRIALTCRTEYLSRINCQTPISAWAWRTVRQKWRSWTQSTKYSEMIPRSSATTTLTVLIMAHHSLSDRAVWETKMMEARPHLRQASQFCLAVEITSRWHQRITQLSSHLSLCQKSRLTSPKNSCKETLHSIFHINKEHPWMQQRCSSKWTSLREACNSLS